MSEARATRLRRPHDRSDPTRSIIYALGANVVIAAAKFAGAFFTGSGALLAEALHSLADTGNEVLLLWGRRQAKRPPSPEHPLGHGRATYFWSFVVAMLLFSVGGVASVYEGFRKLHAHAGLEAPWVAVAILALSAVAEGISQYIALKQIRELRGRRGLWQWFRETRRSELLVVVSENAAALVGLAVALAAVLATMITGNDLYDAAGSMVIGVLLIIVALTLGAEIKSLLIGESAAPAVRRAIFDFLDQREDIVEVTTMITQQQGETILLGVKARMQRTATAGEMVAEIARCEAELKQAFPQVKWVFFEPVPEAKSRRG